MPPPPIFFSRKRTPIQVLIQSSGLTTSQDGNDVAGAVSDDLVLADGATSGTSEEVHSPQSRVIEAFGKRFLLYLDTIRERDEGGAGNWGTVFTFTNPPDGGTSTGLHIVHVKGKQRVCLLYFDVNDTDTFTAVWSDDGINWNEDFLLTTAGGRVRSKGSCIPYRSSLIWCAGFDWVSGDSNLIIYDFDLQTFTAINPSGSQESTSGNNNQGQCDVCVLDNVIFKAFPRVTNPQISGINRLDGVSWTNLYRSTNNGHQSSVNITQGGGSKIIFPDPSTSTLILMANYSGNATPTADDLGVFCTQILNPLTADNLTDSSPGSEVVDLSSTCIPLALTPIVLGGSHTNDEMEIIEAYVDTVTTPGTPTVYVMTAQRVYDTDTETWRFWRWNGVSSLMADEGFSDVTGAATVPSFSRRGGGERIPTLTNARPIWDGGYLLTHGSVTGGPFVVGEEVTSNGTGVGRILNLYSGSMLISLNKGTYFLDTEIITGTDSGATATLSADASDLQTPQEILANVSTKVFFKVQGTGSAINLQVYYNDGSHAPDTLMNLINATVTVEAGSPATTPTNNTTQISNVTPDSSSAVYSIELATTSAGILGGQGYSIMIVPV